MMRLTTNQTALQNEINALQARANSGTMMHVGMIWGWRALSNVGPFGDGAPPTDLSTMHAVIFETDGQNDIGADPDFTGLGLLSSGKMGTTVGCTSSTCVSNATTSLTNRLGTVCANMKAAGIIVYTIGLGLGATGNAAPTLQACAGGPGSQSVGKFYPAPTGAALTAAFQGITQSLNQLRLSQ